MTLINGRVFVTRLIHVDAIDLLRAQFNQVDVWESPFPPTRTELIERTQGCIALIAMLTDTVDAAFLEAVPDLKAISNLAVGHDNLDTAAARSRGILLGNTPGVLTEATADLAFALLLTVARRVKEAADAAIGGSWGPWHPQGWLGQDVHHSVLGVVGLGRIGLAVAKRARGFNMRVLYVAQQRKQSVERDIGIIHSESLLSLLAESDFVTLHVPLTPETHHLIGAHELAIMKPTAFLINTSRGEVVDQIALVSALKQEIIAGAGLDVTSPEPLFVNHPLFELPNVVITPHIGSASHGARRQMAILAARNVIAACIGQSMPSPIDQG